MVNDLVLLHEKAGERLTHGGYEKYRVRSLWLNGVRVSYHSEGSAPDYNRGTYFDRAVASSIGQFEKAARCKHRVVKAK